LVVVIGDSEGEVVVIFAYLVTGVTRRLIGSRRLGFTDFDQDLPFFAKPPWTDRAWKKGPGLDRCKIDKALANGRQASSNNTR
jgi:hypothetical protein